MSAMGGDGRFDLSSLREPIVQAPMAGGPSTPALAIAVSQAGGLGFLAAGYLPVEAVREQLAAVRAGTDRPFGLNLFVPGAPEPAPDRAALERYAASLGGEAARYGAEPGEPRFDDDGWEAKLALAVEARVPVVSFVFGCPPEDAVARLHNAGTCVLATVTEPGEARAAAAAGADALVVQGVEAGGHRGSFADEDGRGELGLLPLLALVRRAAPELPLVAAGGIAVHHLTAPLRAAARAEGDADGVNLWAGEAHALAQDVPAGELVRRLGAGARAAIEDARQRLA